MLAEYLPLSWDATSVLILAPTRCIMLVKYGPPTYVYEYVHWQCVRDLENVHI